MNRDFRQSEWDDEAAEDCRALVRLAMREDLERAYDWTSVALVPPDRTGAADIVARRAGVVAGMPAIATAVEELNADLALELAAKDGAHVAAGTVLATLRGNVRDLLTCERTLLNLLGRLMGVATQTAGYVELVAGTGARIYDTRKTTPGWRRLEKYAVRCGGGSNHRTGLYDAILIKDNHLAQFRAAGQDAGEAAGAALRAVRAFLADEGLAQYDLGRLIVEIEVDSLEQLAAALPETPDIVLLDNMGSDQLRQAAALRDQTAPAVELEASGGITLDNLREIAMTGVNRISVGALTHSAIALDVALDWRSG